MLNHSEACAMCTQKFYRVNERKKLYMNSESSDVTLVVEGSELPAHKIVLTEASDYFKAMFSSTFIEAKSDKVALKETNLDTFKYVLQYIYTGFIPYIGESKQLFEILECARFYMVDALAEETLSLLKCKNPGLLLSNALEYSVDELITYSTDSIQKTAHNINVANVFRELSPQALEHVLKLPLNTQESTIFKALVGWMWSNSDYSDMFTKLLGYIDLYLLDEEQLDLLFEPTELIDRSLFRELLDQQREEAKTVQKVVNQNVIDGLRIIEGWINEKETIAPLYGKTDVIVDLKQQFLLNCLKLTLRNYSYYTVSVSTDMCDWELVIDHSDYECFGKQVLYFNERAVRFICIQGQQNRGKLIINTDIEALYSTDPFVIDPATNLLVPTHNVLSTDVRRDPPTDSDKGHFYDGHARYCYRTRPHQLNLSRHDSIHCHLSQPYIIGSMKLIFKEESSYLIKVSPDMVKWTQVSSDENVFGCQIVTFEKQPVFFIKIVNTRASSELFFSTEIECPAM